MATITRRIRYICDTCQREIDLQENVYGVDVASRCIITSGCRGKMYRAPMVRNKTRHYRPAAVTGLNDWSQRKVLYTHQQSIKTFTWNVEHNLGVNPVVQVFVNRFITSTETELVELAPTEFTVTVVDVNNLQVTFPNAESGTAQCITLTSARNLPINYQPVDTNDAIQLSNESTLTIATRRDDPTIDFELVFNNDSLTTVQYNGVDDSPSIESPWAGINTVFINGRVYTVRSFDVVAHDATVQSTFNSGFVQSGTSFYFSFPSIYSLQGENLILLAQPPFGVADRVFDHIIDIYDVTPPTIPIGLPVIGVNIVIDSFTVSGDYTETFTTGKTFTVSGSTGNDGTWSVQSSVYDNLTMVTTIRVTGDVADINVDGTILVNQFIPLTTPQPLLVFNNAEVYGQESFSVPVFPYVRAVR